MISSRDECTGRWPVHFFKNVGLFAAVLLAATGVPAAAAPLAPAVAQSQQPVSGQTVDDFYRMRNGYPLWLAANSGDAAQQLVGLLSTSNLDGLNPARYNVAGLQQSIEAARTGKRKRIDEADRQLSAAFVAYVTDLRQDPGVGVTYVDPSLRPRAPSPLASLLMAAAAPSLPDYVHSMGWMHPIYGQLRQALGGHGYSTDQQRDVLALNLTRARVLPAGKQRYVLVNAAQQRLYMYEDEKPVDSMVVVVGKPKWPTPMLTAYIRYAALNPYWYVPSDLAGEDVGQFVLKQGLSYLDKMGYEIVDDWTPNPTIIDPKTIDWKGVVDGKVEVLIRQKPGPQNFMGRMKFMFPNQFGVYLHDNPRRELFLKSARYFSGGCVRLEDAARLGRWLFGHDLDWQSAGPEQPVPLAQPVPVYITYLTAMPDGASIAYYDDVYGRDAAKVATAGTDAVTGGTGAGSR
ncbi:L,D-transpeptidase family protein [Sphingomonas agri]|uniref:L,D-transpeptidase family protein n=1 Tax=Sphingomonas agri TaxID=1813878 RepID=UPI00311ECE24